MLYIQRAAPVFGYHRSILVTQVVRLVIERFSLDCTIYIFFYLLQFLLSFRQREHWLMEQLWRPAVKRAAAAAARFLGPRKTKDKCLFLLHCVTSEEVTASDELFSTSLTPPNGGDTIARATCANDASRVLQVT